VIARLLIASAMLVFAGLPIAAQPAAQEPSGETYAYNPAGRRDPFLTLVGRSPSPEPRPAPSRRSEGPAGLLVNEISVRGVMESRGYLVAMIQGPDGRSYIVRPGDALMDATVKAITLQGLVLVQDVHDPVSPGKQRELQKLLRSAEDARP
jgi:Tfp pilus assembly protein PilP